MKAEQLQEFYNPSGKRDPFKPFEGGEISSTRRSAKLRWNASNSIN
ncbi:MAG: hypothetical protein R2877_06510 [Bdellovibrionota bacterium]